VTATFQFLLLLTLLGIALAFLLMQTRVSALRSSKRTDGMLLIVIDGSLADGTRDELYGFLTKRLRRGRLEGISSSEGLTTLHYSFSDMDDREVSGLETGLRHIAPIRKLNLYFNGQGNLI